MCGLGHVPHPGVDPVHVQVDGVAPEDRAGRPQTALAPEVLAGREGGEGGPPPAALDVGRLHQAGSSPALLPTHLRLRTSQPAEAQHQEEEYFLCHSHPTV